MKKSILFFTTSFCLIINGFNTASAQKLHFLTIPDTLQKSRIMAVGISAGSVYASSFVGLNELWYKGYPKSSFHLKNDLGEWNQVDKFGHTYSAYQLSRMSIQLLRWTGLKKNSSVWIGGMTGVAYQSIIEVLDGYSKEWGFSWGDMGANILGSSLVMGQEFAWNEQRIQYKFSAHFPSYPAGPYREITNQRFGTGVTQKLLKDYNAQTYWFSTNVWSFDKTSRFPKWLNIAVGYGANDMYGAFYNSWTDSKGNVYTDENTPHRIRQFYIAPDIDFTKIPTRKKTLRTIFYLLNCLKFPAPTVEIQSGGKFKLHPIYF